MQRPFKPVLAAAVLLSAPPAPAATVVVTIPDDIVDINWQTATVADLPGPDGNVSFSEAMIATNNTPGHDTVAFAIPSNTWILAFLYPGRAIVYSSLGTYFRASDAVTIDGTTQTASIGDTNPAGGEIVIYGSELYLNANGCELLGLDSTPVTVTGSNCLIRDNTGFMNITVQNGAGSRIENNSCGTIKIDRSNDNVVVGNTTTRVRVLGAVGTGQPVTGNLIGGPAAADRNFITGYGTTNSEGLPAGITVQIADALDTVIENNYIGTTPDGMASGSLFSTAGIGLEGENHNTVIRDNLIAGILGHGQGPHHAGQLFGNAVQINGTGSGLTFVGNTVGLDAAGAPTLGSVRGFDVGSYYYLGGMTDIRLGGAGPGEGNVIAGHILSGLVVGKDTDQVRVTRTEIWGNGSPGIDLIPTGFGNGVTLNDALDADTGGNGLQNFPVLTSATGDAVSVRVAGTLDSSPAGEFTLEFFASPACDPSGYGQGQQYLGFLPVTTDATGGVAFQAVLPGAVPEGWMITATATLEPLGATSEFSACLPLTPSGTTATPLTATAAAGPRLHPGVPNPFRSGTEVRFELGHGGPVRLAVFDVSGRRVRTLVNEARDAGVHRIDWDGRRDDGSPTAAGIYFLRLEAEGRELTGRTVRLR